jgi:hypothetical protein
MTPNEEEEVRELLNKIVYSEYQIRNSIVKQLTNNNFLVSVPIPVKTFIEKVLIQELFQVIKKSPWLGFVSISSGIEFLGKCISDSSNWDSGGSKDQFNNAIRQLEGLNKYTFLLDRTDFNLYNELRCGLIHSMAPKNKISLSSGKDEDDNLDESRGRVNFNVDVLFDDFKQACEDVIKKNHMGKMFESRTWVNIEVKYDLGSQPVSFRSF